MRNPGALVVYAAIAVYLLAFVPRTMRRIQFVSTIVVRCTPAAAFALVSDPNNWRRYVPQLELRSPVRTPVQVGDLIYDRMVFPDMTHDAVERVIVSEPGVRFGTQIVGGGHGTTGVYEFAWADGSTHVTYRCHATLTLPEAWLGNGFRRGYITGKMKAARDEVMQRIKLLLEAEPAEVSV
ncbi:MAG TPA: SRPBCC family protein [Candidatus Dormibacteraeota bacterium]|nr:SRPBCC family protein [Candidatus Dormibacteraeota bacterium]